MKQSETVAVLDVGVRVSQSLKCARPRLQIPSEGENKETGGVRFKQAAYQLTCTRQCADVVQALLFLSWCLSRR